MRRLPQCHAAIAAAQALFLAAPGIASEPDAPATQPAAPASQPVELCPPPPARKPFTLSVTDLYVGMELDHQNRRVRSETAYKRGSTHRNRDTRVEEYVGVGLAGDIGDPGLFDWRADLEFGLAQGRFYESQNGFSHTDSDNGFLAEYDINADILKSKPISFNVFARRNDYRIPRRFLPSLHETNNEAGVTGMAVTGPVTTEFGFTWRDIERTGNRQEEDDEHLQTTRAFVNTTWQISEHQKLRLSYEHEDQGSNYQGSRYNFDLKRDELRAEHQIEFGPDHKHRFDTFVRYNAESGDLERDELNFVPRLTLQHTDKLRTVWRYNYYQVKQDVIEVSQHKFDGEALYQATKNLRFSVNGFGLFEHADDDVDTTQWGLGGDIGYVKSGSLGETNINLHVAYDQAQTHGSAGRRLVRNEGHALGDVRSVILRNRNVVRQSILAHSDNYTRIYVQGIDYLATRIGDRTLITRIPFGRIARNDVVYFDYLYDVPAESSVDTWWTSFLLEHRFDFGLIPYYQFDGRFQDVNEKSIGTPVLNQDQNRHRIGVRYDKTWWDLRAEFEIFDDTVEPYNAIHFTGHANLFRKADHSLDIHGEVSHYWFEGGVDSHRSWWEGNNLNDRNVWWTELDVKDTLQILPYLTMNTGTAFHYEDDSRRGRTTGVDLEWGLKLVRGYLTVELTLEYDMLAVVQNREQGFGVFLNVRRDLSHLLPARREQ
ncbi:MAG TPA: hypothetical protein PKG54_13190 [Phycisphaerae bacterium]|nr:hypothetical protein [Phycisphaerae bacterium]HOB75466.1 hypothetical protein [Phycisphaerae bacterium]HOJ55310.1 hypothetical protein [Phycisphaerae bacterium]HOL27402.1 hypothetical protein [Phycisphaerae bacterium]HPP21613.1 hypothetical protein [Phycisphaerae bacterium]